MAFTGKLGTKSSYLGNIVLGIADGLGVGPLGFDVHVLSAYEIRVRFTVRVTDSALDLGNYSLTSLAPPGTAVTPSIDDIRFQDEKQRAVILTVSPNMTTGTDYSLELTDVADETGDCLVNVARNFTANVPAPPKALGAFQSKRGFVDIVFDKPVGPYSSGATFGIRDATVPGPGVPMAQTAWAAEDVPEDTLRVSIPGGTPGASRYAIEFSGVTDESVNSSSGFVLLTLSIRSSPPFSLADLLQFQIVDAYVLGVDAEFLRFGIVRVFWNGPADVDTVSPESQFSAFQSGPHPEPDELNDITAPDAVDLPTLITLCVDIKAKFNAHLVQEDVHLRDDLLNAVTSPDPVDLPGCIALLNEAQTSYLAHVTDTNFHIYRDFQNEFVNVPIGAGNLALAISVANLSLKPSFNDHLLEEQEVAFVVPQSGVMGKVSDHAVEPSSSYDVRSAYSYFTDLHVGVISSLATVRIEASVMSQDTLSSTSTGDFTGNFTARAHAGPAAVQSHFVLPDESVELKVTGDLVLPNQSALSVVAPDLTELNVGTVSVEAFLPTVTASLNFLIVAFNYHISGSSGAVHAQSDLFNSVPAGVSSTDLGDVSDKANELKARMNSHVRNEQDPFHLHVDPRRVLSPDATDFPSLVRLLDEMRTVYVRHNHEGPHLSPGIRVYNAGLFDVLRIETDEMVNGTEYVLRGRIRSSALQLPGNGELGQVSPTGAVRFTGEVRFSDIDLDLDFTGCATSPAVASALPKSGLEVGETGELVFESDQVEVYFSKPMHQVALDSSNLPVTGGGILQKESDWIDGRTASVRVVNMDPIPYTVVAVGLTDRAGNPVV